MNENYYHFAGKISANEYNCNESVQFLSCSIRSWPAAHESRATLLSRVIALREFFVRLARRCLVVSTELRHDA